MGEKVGTSAGHVVRQHRLAQGLTLRTLADWVGVSSATLSAIENDKTGMSVRRVSEIAAALGVSDAELLAAPHPSADVDSWGDAAFPTDWRAFAPLPMDGVLSAAVRAFLETGYHGANMRQISRLANMSVSGVYHHYPSKQDLLVRVLDMTMKDLLWRTERASDGATTTIDRIRLIVEALALFHARRPELGFIGSSEMRSLEPEHYRRIAERRDAVQHQLDKQIQAAVTEGLIHVDKPNDAGKAIATMCTGLTQWYRPGGSKSPEQLAREYSQFAMALLGLGYAED